MAVTHKVINDNDTQSD